MTLKKAPYRTLQSRRTALKNLVVAGASVFAGSSLLAGSVSNVRAAGAMAHLEESDATATALGYKHDATQSDRPADSDAICGNCQLYQPGDEEAWGGCALFPNKAVNEAGWCRSWIKKTG